MVTKQKIGPKLTRRQSLILAENRLLTDFPSNVEISRLSVEGRLEQGRLAVAWEAVARRHDCLRARLISGSGDLWLAFDRATPKMTMIEVATDDLINEIRNFCGHQFASNETLCRALHLRAPSGDHVIIGQSHLVSDGTTKAMIFKDLGEFYVSGNEQQDLRYTFENYLRSASIDEELEKTAAEYWSEQLASPAPALRLYGEAPLLRRGRLETSTIQIDSEIAGALMARRYRSPSLAMTAVVAALLHRVTGEETIAVGVPIANRAKGTADIGGLFMEVVPNRIVVDPSKSLADLAAAIADDARLVRPYRDYAISGAMSGHEVMLNYRPTVVDEFAGMNATQAFLTAPHYLPPGSEIELNGAGVGVLIEVMRDSEGSPFEIAVHVDVARWPQNGLGSRLLRHFKRVLQTMAQAPGTAIGAIELLGDNEAAESILGPDRYDPIPGDLIDVLSAVRARSLESPESEAVRFGTNALNYRDVVKAADSISGALVARGISSGDLVAVCLRRSEMLPVVLLGIAGSGAAYIPLDPDHSKSRSALILEDAKPSLVILAPDSIKAIDTTHHSTIELDALLQEKVVAIDPPSGPGASLDSAAYVIFTSGSTGRPKGVQVSHRNLAAFLLAMAERPGLAADMRLLAVTTITFDISALELFGPLVSGGTVLIAPEVATRDPRALMELMAKDRITMLQATPATWRMLVETGWRDPELTALCGGEALSQPLADSLVDRCKAIWNMYGPTETTIWSMVSRVTADGPVVLGTPIRGTRIALRTAQGALVPRGAPGEITIEGAGVADGYYGRPDLTADRFVGEGESRRYRTGDLAALATVAANGENFTTLKYLGRTDHQVKVRGFRIELGEIEAQIDAVTGVSAAVVTTVEGALETKALAAYWSGDYSTEVEAAIKARIKNRLPPYMHPSSFTHVGKFPLSPSGKIDRAQLPKPDLVLPERRSADSEMERPDAQPRDEAELQLAEQIGKTLGYETVPVDVPISEFGLDSLSHLTLSLDLERKLGGSLPPDWEDMSIRRLAANLPSGKRLVSIQTPVLVRALLITDVVAGHFGLFGFPGSIQGLLLVAGFSFGRFLVPTCHQRSSVRPILGLIGNIVLPTLLAIVFLQTYFGQFDPAAWFLINNYVPPDVRGSFSFWFVEVMIQNLVILALLFSMAPVRGLAVTRPLETALAFLAVTYALSHIVSVFWNTDYLYNRVPQQTIWLMALGWCVAVSREVWQWRLTVAVSVSIAGIEFFLDGSLEVQPAIALAFILAFEQIRIPRQIAHVVVYVASASLFIYLTHFPFLWIVMKLPDPLTSRWLAFPVALVGGIICYLVWERFMLVLRTATLPEARSLAKK